MSRLRFYQDQASGDVRVEYRRIPVGGLWFGEDDWNAHNYVTGEQYEDTSKRRVRQWLGRSLRALDLYTWWGVYVGAKEG